MHGNDAVFADAGLNEQLKKLPGEIKSQDSWFIYTWLGVDIAHSMGLGDNYEDRITVYRFFDKKEPAEKSLEVIQKIIPSAESLCRLQVQVSLFLGTPTPQRWKSWAGLF